MATWYNGTEVMGMSVRRQLADKERLRLLGAWRYYRRIILGRSCHNLAQLLGVSRGKVQRWESSRSDQLPDIGDIVALARALHVEPVDLFAWILKAGEIINHGR